LHQRGPRKGQFLSRSLDAQLGDIAMRRKPRGVTEQSGEVEGAETCLRSEILKPYARPQLRLDIVEHPFHPVRIERWRSCRRSPTANRIVSKKMRRQSHLQPIHEKAIGRLSRTIEQTLKCTAYLEDCPVPQPADIGDLGLRWINLMVGQGVLINESRRHVDMEALHRVRELEPSFLRCRRNEIAHARPRDALLGLTVAGTAEAPAPTHNNRDLSAYRDKCRLGAGIDPSMLDAQGRPFGRTAKPLTVPVFAIPVDSKPHDHLRVGCDDSTQYFAAAIERISTAPDIRAVSRAACRYIAVDLGPPVK